MGNTEQNLARAERMLRWWEQQHPDQFPPFAVSAPHADEVVSMCEALPGVLREYGEILIQYFAQVPDNPAEAFTRASYAAQQLVRALENSQRALIEAERSLIMLRAAEQAGVPVALILNQAGR